MMQSSGGSFGLQAGGEETDYVILVMNDEGARRVMKGRAKLGADAIVAAGPVGRDAEASTSATMQARMLSYSRAKGVFGGLSLEGTSLGPDEGDNKKLSWKKVSGEKSFREAYMHLHRLGRYYPSCKRHHQKISPRGSPDSCCERDESKQRRSSTQQCPGLSLGYVAVIVTKPIVTTLTHRTHDAPRWCTKGLGSAWRNHETPGWI